MAGSSELARPEMLATAIPPPLWLLAELTYRCPLHCVFCYNPTQHARLQNEMSTAQWVDVMRQARTLGAAQLGFSGGEPLLRDDLEELVQEARHLGFYSRPCKIRFSKNTLHGVTKNQFFDDHVSDPIAHSRSPHAPRRIV